MSYARRIEVGLRRIVVTGRGDATIEEVVAEVAAIARDLADHRGFSVLVDTRNSTYAPSLADIQRIVESFRANRGAFAGGIAVVVEGVLHFGLGRMFATLADLGGLTIEVFLSDAQAGKWLDSLRVDQEPRRPPSEP